MKRTLRRELKVPEIAEWEANGARIGWQNCRVQACRGTGSARVYLLLDCATHVVFFALTG